MKTKCSFCGKIINKRPCELKNSKNVFCSKNCHYEFIKQPNYYEICNDYTKVFLNSDEYFIIDTQFINIINRKWRKYNGYIIDRDNNLIHRIITNCPKGLVVDHINHNPLDNRLKNLRICTISENCQNRASFCRNSCSKVRGVYFSVHHNRYVAHATIKGKKYKKYFENSKIGFEQAIEYSKHLRAKYLPFSIN